MNSKEIKGLSKEFKGDDLYVPGGEKNQLGVYDRYMNLSKQVGTWRKLTILFGIISAISIGGFVYKSFEQQYIPYVIRLDQGVARGEVVSSNASNVQLNEREYEYFLTNVITKLRNIPVDQKLYLERLDETYPYLSRNAKNKFQHFINTETNTNAVLEAKYTIKTVIESFIKYADNKYQVNWVETTFNPNGEKTFEVKYTAILDITYIDVKTVEQIRTNPLGIVIRDIEIKKVGG